jgi:hypothetical protein
VDYVVVSDERPFVDDESRNVPGVIKEHPEYGDTTIFSNAEDVGAAAVP